MLDAQIVKTNGQVVWASAEPDLLWALRGGGGGFGGKIRAMYDFHKLTKPASCHDPEIESLQIHVLHL